MNKQEKLKIIDETVKNIEKHGRSLDDDYKCIYVNPKPSAPGCAIGMWMTLEQKAWVLENHMNTAGITELFEGGIPVSDKIHPDNVIFLRELQWLHDGKTNWNCKINKLSITGKTILADFKMRVERGEL